MKTKILIITLTTMVFVFLAAGISWSGERFHHRQKRQLTRIADGIRSGEITNREFRHLNREQWRIRQFKKRARADGWISRPERKRLHRMHEKAGKHIYRAKHNGARYDGCRKKRKHHYDGHRSNYGHRPKYQHHRRHPKPYHYGHRPAHEGFRVNAQIFQPGWSLAWSLRDAW
jgi:hypothetical protein